ncbi:MAG TPA: adenylate/guanylate cyclase domain-containing protein [Bdellovibrionota bacterium]|nr:adenylate/guanylate cyclase domain-containing protein [Bdellovibrionota bacterium]
MGTLSKKLILLQGAAILLGTLGVAAFSVTGLDKILTEELGGRTEDAVQLARGALYSELQGVRTQVEDVLTEARDRRLGIDDTRDLLASRLSQQALVLAVRVRAPAPARGGGGGSWVWGRAKQGSRISLLDVRFPVELEAGQDSTSRFALLDEGHPALRLTFRLPDGSGESYTLDVDPAQLQGAHRAANTPVDLVLLDSHGRASGQWPEFRYVPGESLRHLVAQATTHGIVRERPDGPWDVARTVELGVAGTRLIGLASHRHVMQAQRPWTSLAIGWGILVGVGGWLACAFAIQRLLGGRARQLRASLVRALERPAPGLLSGAEPPDELSILALDAQRAMDRIRHRERHWSSLAKFGTEDPPRLPEDAWVEVVYLSATVQGLAEGLDPAEGAREIIEQWNDLLQSFRESVEHHGGVLDQIQGTELTAFWGITDPSADPAEGAWEALALMNAKIQRVNIKRRDAQAPPLRFTAGVHRGKAYAAHVGPEGRREYTMLGDAPRVATALREMAAADGDGILLSAVAWPLNRLGPDQVPPRGRPAQVAGLWSGTVHSGPQGQTRALEGPADRDAA